jgi:hypothetical protein
MKHVLGITLLACFLFLDGLAQGAVLSRNSNLRSGPSSSNKLIKTLSAGAEVTIISKYPRSGYVKVKVAGSDHTGWVWKKNVTEGEATAKTPPSEAVRPPENISGTRVGDDQIYPRSDLTPGKADPRVTQDNIAKNICNKGWTTDSVRPSTAVTNKIKQKTMLAYGFTDAANHYELDHLISLQNGGCPDCIENLFPQAYGDKNHKMTQNERANWNRENRGSAEVLPGALEKDLVESHIHDEICRDIPNAKMSMYSKKYPATISVTLKRGQEILATDWYACYRKMMDGNKPCE